MQEPAEASGDPAVQRLFGVGMHTRLVCEESGEAIEEDTNVYELKCAPSPLQVIVQMHDSAVQGVREQSRPKGASMYLFWKAGIQQGATILC